jgi:hypothetical protein
MSTRTRHLALGHERPVGLQGADPAYPCRLRDAGISYVFRLP